MIEAIYAMSDNICEVRDDSRLPYDLDEIAEAKNLKGLFTKKILDYLEANPNEEQIVSKAIEITYRYL